MPQDEKVQGNLNIANAVGAGMTGASPVTTIYAAFAAPTYIVVTGLAPVMLHERLDSSEVMGMHL